MEICQSRRPPPYPCNTLSLGTFSIRPLGSNLYLQQLIYAPTTLAPLFKLHASSSRFGFPLNRYWIYVLNTLELTANLALEIILGSTMRRIYSRDCQRSWECWMSSGWRLPCVSNDGWHTLYDPSTWDTASIPVCPPCIVYALYVDRILRPGRLALTCARHIVPLQCLVGRVRWGDGARSHNAPISALYRQSPDSVRRNQAIVDTSLWPRGARSDVGSSVFRSILHPRISRAKVLSGRAGYWEQAEEMRMMIQFFNDSWKGWPEPEPENKLRVYPRHSRHQQSKTTHLWQYWSTHIVRCYQVSMSLLILNAWCNEMCTKFSILLQVLFLSVWTAATLSLMRFSRIWLNFLTAMDRVRGQWCVRQQWAGMLAEELL